MDRIPTWVLAAIASFVLAVALLALILGRGADAARAPRAGRVVQAVIAPVPPPGGYDPACVESHINNKYLVFVDVCERRAAKIKLKQVPEVSLGE
jgi:hypothetical protein